VTGAFPQSTTKGAPFCVPVVLEPLDNGGVLGPDAATTSGDVVGLWPVHDGMGQHRTKRTPSWRETKQWGHTCIQDRQEGRGWTSDSKEHTTHHRGNTTTLAVGGMQGSSLRAPTQSANSTTSPGAKSWEADQGRERRNATTQGDKVSERLDHIVKRDPL
jgi:hypothetical protein